MSAYPTDAYYDPARPSWLPYWIDDLTESKNKAAYLALNSGSPFGTVAGTALATATTPSLYTLPPPPPPVQPPDMATDPTGQGVNVDAQIAAQHAAYVQSLQDWAAQQAAANPVNDSSIGGVANCLASAASMTDYANCLAGNPIGTPGIPTWVWVLGLGLVGLVVVKEVV